MSRRRVKLYFFVSGDNLAKVQILSKKEKARGYLSEGSTGGGRNTLRFFGVSMQENQLLGMPKSYDRAPPTYSRWLFTEAEPCFLEALLLLCSASHRLRRSRRTQSVGCSITSQAELRGNEWVLAGFTRGRKAVKEPAELPFSFSQSL